MTDSTHTKKRKREENHHDKVTLAMSSESMSTAGPVIVAFPALQPAQSTAFKCYAKRPKKSSAGEPTVQDFASKGTIIAGETDSVEFYSRSTAQDPRSPSCQYLIGVHDKTTNKVTLRHAPLHVLTRDVKAFKSLDPLASGLAFEERVKARNLLGEAFGSKKAKQAIRATERNRVDVSAMEGVAGYLQDSIDAGTGSLPSKEAAKAAADGNRPIPQCNVYAKLPEDIYALHDIISEAELSSISVTQIMLASNDSSRISLLPYSRSSWVNQHLISECAAATSNKTNLKILFYISSMFLFRHTSVDDKTQLLKRMSSVPSEIVEGLLAKFTEHSRNSTKAQTTKQMQTLLLTHMFALCLRVDNYATDPTLIAADLSMSVRTVTTHFKQLGCKVEALTVTERNRLGLGPAVDKEPNRCILRVPLDFPKQRTHKRK
ncbi:RNA polymerase I associated factor, A49-like protein [Ramaria rubella]|nr:RNA polymerase I associated factor, A49-like protein [Ramaria rubella]